MIIGCIFNTQENGMSNKIELLGGNRVCDGKENCDARLYPQR